MPQVPDGSYCRARLQGAVSCCEHRDGSGSIRETRPSAAYQRLRVAAGQRAATPAIPGYTRSHTDTHVWQHTQMAAGRKATSYAAHSKGARPVQQCGSTKAQRAARGQHPTPGQAHPIVAYKGGNWVSNSQSRPQAKANQPATGGHAPHATGNVTSAAAAMPPPPCLRCATPDGGAGLAVVRQAS